MEIEINPVTLDDRITHLQQTSGIQEANKKPFPWSVAIAFLVIGTGIGIGAYVYYQAKKKREKEPS